MEHLVITIGCEYGAKGNQIGKKVAQDLGIKFYDRETVDEIIKEVGIPKDIMEKVEEGVTIAGKGAEGAANSFVDYSRVTVSIADGVNGNTTKVQNLKTGNGS